MSKPSDAPTAPIRAVDRILGFGALVIVAVSVLCFLAIIIGSATGMRQEDFGHGVWPLVAAAPMWGLPLGLAMIIVLLIMTFVRNGRAARRS